MGCVLQAASGTPSEREIRHSEPAWVPEDASTGWGSKAIDTCAARRWGVIKMQEINLNFFKREHIVSAACMRATTVMRHEAVMRHETR